MASPAMRVADDSSLPPTTPLPAKSASCGLRQLPAQGGNQADDPDCIRVGRRRGGAGHGLHMGPQVAQRGLVLLAGDRNNGRYRAGEQRLARLGGLPAAAPTFRRLAS